jgi:hypothetical protein
MIPGTHDSGTYAIDSSSPMSPDAPEILTLLNDIYASLVARWAKTQNFDINKQLNAEIRYFDLRVAQNNHSEFYIVHGKYSIPVVSLLDAVASFSDKNPYEIIILDFNHFYQMNSSSHDYLVSLINQKIGNKLLPKSMQRGITPRLMWSYSKKIIITYSKETSQGSNFFNNNPSLWSDSIRSYWPNTSDMNTLIISLNNELKNKPNQKLWGYAVYFNDTE